MVLTSPPSNVKVPITDKTPVIVWFAEKVFAEASFADKLSCLSTYNFDVKCEFIVGVVVDTWTNVAFKLPKISWLVVKTFAEKKFCGWI